MKIIKVNTGFGYYVDQAGHKIAKAELPIGEHPLRDGFIYVEVANKPALDAIDLWIDPADIELQNNEAKITARTRKISVDQLIAEGQLSVGYE